MAFQDIAPLPNQTGKLELQPGPSWGSFEQFRTTRPSDIRNQLPPGHVGRLFMKGDEYVIVHARTFNLLYGLARAADWLSGSFVLVRQAVQLVHRTPENEIAVQHLNDLVFRLGDVAGQPHEEFHSLTFAPDEHADSEPAGGDFELDPAKVRRPVLARSR